VSGDAELHSVLLFACTNDICRDPVRRRSFDGAMPIASRYLATVRRATGMPSPESSSAIRPSDRGVSTFSSLASFLILARIAVEDVPDPSAPSTWLEKK